MVAPEQMQGRSDETQPRPAEPRAQQSQFAQAKPFTDARTNHRQFIEYPARQMFVVALMINALQLVGQGFERTGVLYRAMPGDHGRSHWVANADDYRIGDRWRDRTHIDLFFGISVADDQ